MRYRYPKINNWLVFNRMDSGEYEVTDYLNEEEYTFGNKIARFAKCLDGHTDPFSISGHLSDEEVTSLLKDLDKHGLLRRSRVLHVSAGGLYYTLWSPNARIRRLSFPTIINRFLQILFLPVFIFGCIAFFSTLPDLTGQAVTLYTIIGILTGMTLHEIAHAVACMAYGGKVFEIGAMLKLPFPGAYVLMDSDSIKSTLKRIQVDAAGIEANLLLSGISFLLAVLLPWSTRCFFYIAMLNAQLALMNLLLIDGLDGAGIMSELLGLDSLREAVNSYHQNMKKHRSRRCSSCFDIVYSTTCVSIALVQPAYVALFILSIWVIISWIV